MKPRICDQNLVLLILEERKAVSDNYKSMFDKDKAKYSAH